MKKAIALSMAAVMAALSLAACGSSGSTAATTAAPAATEAPAAEAGDFTFDKTVNVYITHGAGGDTDYMARMLSQALEEKLGVSVVCSNVTGSNGATCMQQYKDGDTDGYTYICSNTAALNGNEATGMVDFGYDAFEPVAIYGIQSGENIVVPADSPYETLDDLIEASKANPGTIKLGISTGGGVYIQACVMTNLGGAEFNIIDSGDAATRLTALLGGEVDATSLPYSTVADYIENGQLKSLCTMLSQPPTLLPDQKSASETIPELVIDTEYVMLAPKGTDPAAVKAMNDAILEVTSTDDWKQKCNDYSFQDPFVLNLDETVENLQSQRELFTSFKDFL
ncbi:MAG: tripartite tricarboxylate transporter substrate binding protein [Lachnospiraceae bacterium]|jgi:tripartite-type tricarboxylate transporter receptor subunit TctC|nr:tripartite tricarboxylate transporter substrate binding protein [Lachnospiraceae bacterium]